MSNHLMMSRRFAPLFWCQFFSAFNDNFLKSALGFLIVFHLGSEGAASLNTLAMAIFMAPFFMLSGLGGQLADRFDKAVVARRLKFAEIFVVGIAIAGFAAHAVAVLFVALALFGVISALFGPIKYGILPDHLARAELPTGNALIEAATFAAIMGGAILASYVARDGGNPAIFGVLIMTFALLCWGASRMIPPTGEGAPDLVVQWNIARSTADMLKHIRADSRLWWAGMVTSWFWVVGAVVLSLLLPAGEDRVQRHRGRGHLVPGDLHGRDRGGLRARRLAGGRADHPAADRGRRGSARPVRARPRLGDAHAGAGRKPDRCRRGAG